jgi:PAS domain S-box-containing protein
MSLAIPVAIASWQYGWKTGLLYLLLTLVILSYLIFSVDLPVETGTVFFILAGLNLIIFLAGLYGHGRNRRLVSEINRLELLHQTLALQIESGHNKEKRLASLNRVSSVLTQSLELDRVLKGAIDSVIDVMEVEVALIYGLESSASRLRLLSHEGVSTDFAAYFETIPATEGYFGIALRENRSIFIENASKESGPGQAEMKRMRIQAQILMPLRARGALVGVLCIASRRPRIFQVDEIEVLEVIADEVGIAIENARLYQEQKRISEALANSERDFRSLFENSHDAIWFHDLKGITIAINNSALLLTGYTMEETKGMPVMKLLTDDGLILARETKTKLLSGYQLAQPYEQKLVRADGTIAFVKLTTSLVLQDGKPSGFQHIARDVTVEKRMQDNLRYYVSQITHAQEEERRRIARELHDDTCQSLYAISRHIDNYLRYNLSMSENNSSFLKGVQKQVVEVLGGVRRFSQDLRPSVLDDLGLLPALQWLIRETESAYGLSGSLQVSGTVRRFSSEVEVGLFRIVQEALSNIGRHAKAKNTCIVLEFLPDRTVVRISDDGQGFNLPSTLADLTRDGKLGLAGMEERTILLGGKLTVHSNPGNGTQVMVNIPLDCPS